MEIEEELIKISELDPVDTLYEGCCMPLVQNNETKKVTYQVLKEKLQEDLNIDEELEDFERRVSEVESNEYDQNEHIRDLISGYRNKVDKVTGKGLSTNDYTTEEKNKLNAIESGAEVNNVDDVKVNGTSVIDENKVANIDLTEYIQETTFTQDQTRQDNLIDDLINALPSNEVSGTNIHITDATALLPKKFSSDGNSHQETTSGIQMLFDNSQHFPLSIGGVNVNYDDTNGTFTFNGTPTSTWAEKRLDGNVLDFEEGNYTLYQKVDGTMPGNFYVAIGLLDSGGTIFKRIQAQAKPTSKEAVGTLTLTNEDISNIAKTRFVMEGLTSNQAYNINVELMLVKGDYTLQTIPPIEKYSGGKPSPNPDFPQEIESVDGYNLFDKNSATIGKLVDRTNGNLNTNENYGASDFIPVVAGKQYTFNGFNFWYTAVYDKSKRYLTNVDNSQTITIPSGAYYLRTSFQLSYTDTAQFVKGSTVLPYQPYHHISVSNNTSQVNFNLNNEKLRKINNVADKLIVDLSTGNYYKQAYIGEVVLDGSRYWDSWSSTSNDYVGFYCNNNQFNNTLKVGSDETDYNYKLISKNFSEPKTRTSIVNGITEGIKQCGGNGNPYIAVGIKKTRLTEVNINGFKNWLSTHNTIVDYELATPSEPILLGTLSSEDLAKLKLFKGTNNIEMLTNLPSTIHMEYVQDIKSLINNLTNAVISLGGNI